ncbi:MAG: aspartyl/asparaginyl beta-hydroxylase domain-containing protein [Alphaproteobacteria bacterium]|nr:aspartyl/asparaginyl beta-hydroxylase domain-containing protein [Alphaproteobacteria bacterium]
MDGDAAAYVLNNDQRIRTLISAAKQHAERGQRQEAQRLMRQAEMEAPNHPRVLNEAGLRKLNAGDPAGALALFEQVVAGEPDSPELLFNYASTLRRLDRVDEAAEIVDRLLLIDPSNLSALIEKGELQELQYKPRAAAMSYRAALQSVPPDFRAPAWMETKLRHAREAVDANTRALESYIGEGLAHIRARHADEPLHRFDQCVEIMLQKRGIYRQQPTFMYFPEMPTIEFYDRGLFPWIGALEAAADDIRRELLAVLAEGNETLDPYVDLAHTVMDKWRELNHSRRWGVYSLWREGKSYPEHIARCPKTVEAIEEMPRWNVPGSGPTAMFSILDAKSRIPPHTGPVNTRLVCHLPLIVPPGCGFRVGGQQREWQPGKAFVFDDSINHEAWNDGDLPRAVLICDIWSPYLSAAERELARALTVRIGEFYGTMSNSGMGV